MTVDTEVARAPWERTIPTIPPTRWVDGELPALSEVTADVARNLETFPRKGWWACMAVALTALMIGVGMAAYLFTTGIGVWGLNNDVGWAFDITNFVFWIGIGH